MSHIQYDWNIQIIDPSRNTVLPIEAKVEYLEDTHNMEILASPHAVVHLTLKRLDLRTGGNTTASIGVNSSTLPEFFNNGMKIPREKHREFARFIR